MPREKRLGVVKLTLELLSELLAIPEDVFIIDVIYGPEERLNQTIKLIVSGTNSALPIVREHEEIVTVSLAYLMGNKNAS